MIKCPNVRHLQYLIALYDHQHFGEAAKSCFISQSTLSTAISSLEDQLRVALLERGHKTFIFTPLGHEIVRLARQIIEHCSNLTELAEHHMHPMHGRLMVGCIPTIAPFILSELLTISQTRYPKLKLLVREEITDNALQALTTGNLDAVILALPYKTSEFNTNVIARDHFKLVLHHDWMDKGFEKEVCFWPDESLFLLEHEHCLTHHTLQACEIKQKRKIHPFYATSLHTIVQMVNHKLGVTYLPQLAIASDILTDTEVISLSPKTERAYRNIGIAWRKTSSRTEEFYRLADMIKEVIKDKCELMED